MKAMLLQKTMDVNEGSSPLAMQEIPIPQPGPGEILIKVSVCGVCHTELDEIEGRTPPPVFPMVPGHQVVGTVEKLGQNAHRLTEGQRVGVAWIFSACGTCPQCRAGHENLCEKYKATGRDAYGGYAEYMVAPETFVYPIPDTLQDAITAPLLCAGAVGYRALRLTGIQDGQALGFTGFGGSGHIILQAAQYLYPNLRTYVFARSAKERTFAEDLGAIWTGDTRDTPPEELNAIIDTTPVWLPVVEAMRCLAPGGRLVINAIRKLSLDQDELLNLNYSRHLWMEKEIKSVANVTRRDVEEFLPLAAKIPIKPAVEEFRLSDANRALIDLKTKDVRGAKVLRISG